MLAGVVEADVFVVPGVCFGGGGEDGFGESVGLVEPLGEGDGAHGAGFAVFFEP